MSTTAVMPFEVCIDYHNTMAALATTGRAIKREASILALARDFWSLARNFKSLLGDLAVYDIGNTLPDSGIVQKLRELHSSVNGLLDLSAKRGLTNRTLIAGSIHSLRNLNKQLVDVVEQFEIALDPAVSQAVEDAFNEYRRGETVPLSSL